MKGLLEEGDAMMKKTAAGSLRNAVMITGAQKVEHYEIASYGTVRTYAQVLGETMGARLCAQILKEEKLADKSLTTIAEGGVNEDAAEEWQSQEIESALSRTAAWAESTAAAASRQVAKGIQAAASTVGLVEDHAGRRRTTGGRARKATRKPTRERAGTKKR